MTSDPSILPLQPSETRHLRISWLSSFESRSLARFLEDNHAPAFWIPETGEYIVGSWWRGRPEIGQIVEAGGRRGRTRLVEHFVDSVTDRGAHAVVLSVSEAWREGRWYRQNGFHEIDRIVTMLQSPLVVPPSAPSDLDVRPFTPADIDRLLTVDQTSFPWLWWNAGTDFERYRLLPGVNVLTGWSGEDLVSYASSTVRSGRGHLDRIAVRQRDQGRGYGRAMLRAALADLAERGAREVALTTQVTNKVAQRLYQSVGFRRTDEVEPIIGRWTAHASAEDHVHPVATT